MKRQVRPKKRLVRSLRNGQITIPAEFRRELGIEYDSLLEVSLAAGSLTITPVNTTSVADSTVAPGGSPWLHELYQLFAPVREEAEAYTEVEIDDAIDAAVQAVRSKRR